MSGRMVEGAEQMCTSFYQRGREGIKCKVQGETKAAKETPAEFKLILCHDRSQHLQMIISC